MTAPLFNALAEGPEDGQAVWLTTPDRVRLRAGLWNAGGPRGTVILLPGRTEFVEKYGRTARRLAEAGFATLSLDFRGQGLSDRPLPDRMVGHVADFAEFQTDIDTLLTFAHASGLPRPFHLLAHSMGGAIGLRALMRGIPVQSAAFTAPMWGIEIPAWQRPFALPLSSLAVRIGLGHRYAPGTGPATYVLDAPFADNTLTTDPAMWDYMRAQVTAEPGFALGGPSLAWLHAALTECRALARLPSPALPCLCALGGNERIVQPGPIRERMQVWQNGRLRHFDGAEHEILMERPDLREAFLTEVTAFFG